MAATVWEYTVPTVPAGNGLAVLIVSVAGLMVNANALDAVCGEPAESCAWIVKFAVPAVVGVPLIAPVPAFNVSPAGSAPAVTLHVYGGVPPVAAIVCEYAVDTVPAGSGLPLLIVRVGGLIVSVYALDAVCGGAAASCTPTVKLAVPAVVGVPVMAPVELFSVSPAGNDPAVIAHVYGVVPPVTAILCE